MVPKCFRNFFATWHLACASHLLGIRLDPWGVSEGARLPHRLPLNFANDATII